MFNIPPVQINATGLIYQVSCSSVLAIDAVRDGGAALAVSADYGTYDLLAAATVAPGAYATCIALGLFRLGSAPVSSSPPTCAATTTSSTASRIPTPGPRSRAASPPAAAIEVVPVV